jgi:UDP-N-acetylglucosamine 2-epimerase
MLSVMTIVGTRPEVIRLSRIIPLFDRYCRHTLVHTGQNYDYELNQVFFDELAIRQPETRQRKRSVAFLWRRTGSWLKYALTPC